MAIHRHFDSADTVVASVIRQVGPFTLRKRRDYFRVLVGSIISQQISTAAARTIRARLEASVSPDKISPEAISAMSVDQLRSVGLSRQKAGYILDLATKCTDGTLRLSGLGRRSDAEAIDQLTQVKGIGRWSAQMFLIFALRRLDVFPHDDLGVRTAIRRLYGFAELPTKDQTLQIGERWRPYCSVGAWYCWRYLELPVRPPAPSPRVAGDPPEAG